jgi:glucosamine--fructose-6-phosphate aminotransferase (isomerizing)
VLAITNTTESALAAEADESLDVLAGPEAGGVACRSFACTQAVLALMCGAPPDDIRMAAAAVAHLIEGRERWLPALVEVAEAARGVWVCGPAERFGSAQQSALMLREGPRIIADACETGDWLHVDVGVVAGWRRERDFRLVSVGRELAGADAAIAFDGADRRVVAAIAETAVSELLAAELWRRNPI